MPKDLLTLMLIIKNEAPYLAEWLEFYQLQGVQHIFVYDHGSTDEYREVLARYPEVQLRQAIPTNQAQQTAWNEVLTVCQTPWLVGLDIDEFLFWPEHDSFLDYLDQVDTTGLAGLTVRWTQMQSTDETQPPGLVIENYCLRRQRRARPGAYKAIVRPLAIQSYHSVHRVIGREGFVLREDTDLQLNHYFTKSRAEFEQKRAKHLPGLAAPGRVPDVMLASDYDRYNGEPAVPETSIRRYVPALKERLSSHG